MAGLVDALGPRRVTLFYGERREEDLVDRFYLEKLVGRNYEATAEILEPRPPEEPGGLGAEDLSFPDSELAGLGYPLEGLVTGPLSEALAAEKRPVFACGPPGLLGALAGLAEGAGVPYFACAEATMGCGLGVCLSCSLPGAGGRNFKVCQDGPVVNGLEIDWKKINAR
ncbi:MAG: hypothetical protein LBO05_14085 [Deltaproteobacteria bacterium]|nr:hypothetical protein [Deltaproteobacteria bacterium]